MADELEQQSTGRNVRSGLGAFVLPQWPQPDSNVERGKVKEAHVRLGTDGRLVIPVAFRKRLGLQTRDHLLVRLGENGVTIEGRQAAVRAAQCMVRERVPKGELLTEQLLKMRRAENASG